MRQEVLTASSSVPCRAGPRTYLTFTLCYVHLSLCCPHQIVTHCRRKSFALFILCSWHVAKDLQLGENSISVGWVIG